VIALAFGFCYALIFFSQRAKKETIVYLDKKIESATSQQTSAAGQSHDSLNLNALRQKIRSGNPDEKLQNGLNELCNQLNAGQGAIYEVSKKGEDKSLDLKSGYALVLAEGEANPSFNWGEGLIGQAAASGKSEYLEEMPEGYASRIESGLGSALPKFLFVFPIKKENECIGVIEVATFTHLSEALRKDTLEAGNILSEIS
jgi:methyl-accepting chemotaxis protein